MDWLNSRPGETPLPPSNGPDSDNDLPRDDLFHDPAYKTHLFDILAVLQTLAIKIDEDEDTICPWCKSELFAVIRATCQAWLDNPDNTDFPLNPRKKITEVKGKIEEDSDVCDFTPLLRITTALGYNTPKPELMINGMKVRTALERRWFRNAAERFIAHVPLPEGASDAEAAEKYQKEWQYKLWYLLLGKKFLTKHLVYEDDIFTFATNHFELAGILANQTDERFCGNVDCWPYPPFDFSAENPEECPEMFDILLGRMVKKIRNIILDALESDAAPRWLKGEKDAMLILHTVSNLPVVKERLHELREDTAKWYLDDCSDWVFDWSVGYSFRDGRDVPGAPIGEEDVLRAYEVLRMTKIVDKALGVFGFGRLLDDEDEDEEMAEEDHATEEMELDLEEILETPHPCDAGLGSNFGERYYE
ncbi:hypothetical protein V8F20_002303 [Naviculisporaceae sp. PSN 640]